MADSMFNVPAIITIPAQKVQAPATIPEMQVTIPAMQVAVTVAIDLNELAKAMSAFITSAG